MACDAGHQSKDNLRKRHVLNSAEELACPFCGQEDETTSHILLSCIISSQVWYGVFAWRGIYIVPPASPRDHLLQFPLFSRNKEQRVGELAIWMATAWSIWLMRNRVVFNGAALDVEQVVESSQVKAWQWMRAKVQGFCYSWFEWKSNVGACLDSL